ncbi:MAG: PepSY-like domain-containing protein [Candidatus Aminicenantes bacterium]|nr:MAG: PepSY-like domain-containing protein [Candidatus Aminicenantes bacterium]
MKHINPTRLFFVAVLALALTLSTGCIKQEGIEQEEKAEPELPAAVLEAVKADFPDAQIDKVEIVEEAGITLYDIEFKADQGEIEVAQDGTILDVATVITMEDLPKAAAEAIQKAAEGTTIKRLEKSEVRSEIREEDGKGILIKFDIPRYIYEAELVKGDQRGEIEVDADGNIIEELNWDITDEKKKEGSQNN